MLFVCFMRFQLANSAYSVIGRGEKRGSLGVIISYEIFCQNVNLSVMYEKVKYYLCTALIFIILRSLYHMKH